MQNIVELKHRFIVGVSARFIAIPVNYDFPSIEDNMLNKLLGIFLPLAIKDRIKNRACPWASFIFTKIFQVNLKDISEGHCVLVSNWMLMLTTLGCLTTL